MAIYSDINLTNRDNRDALVAAWQDNDMQGVLDELSDSDVAHKGVIASMFNTITSAIATRENAAQAQFKGGIIKTASSAPAGMTSGQVYFEEA